MDSKELKQAFDKTREIAEKYAKEGAEIAKRKYEENKPKIEKAVTNGKVLASKAIQEAKTYTKETAIPAVKDAAKKTSEAAVNAKDKTEEALKFAQQKAINKMDQNGDGKFDQEDVQIILNSIYSQSIDGIQNISKPVKDICEEYLNRYKDPKLAVEKLVASDIVKCTTSGFVTGFGGLLTLPVTIPANVSSVLYVQMRMIASVAYMAGLDINSDATKTLTYACLAGVSVADAIKQTGLKFGTKLTTSLIEKIPGKTLTAINQKVGFRMLTKFGSKGVVNLGKMVPFVGAVIGGSFDLVETKIIANRAIKEFFDGDFTVKEKIEDEVIDAEFNKVIEEESSPENNIDEVKEA